jgi:hypothetical protein
MPLGRRIKFNPGPEENFNYEELMKAFRYELSVETKGQLLHQLRTVVFYQVELWNVATSVTTLLNECQEGDWDTVYRLQEVRTVFGDKILTAPDVDIFVENVQKMSGGKGLFRAVLNGKQRDALKQRLQKAVWIQNELWKMAALMAPTLGCPSEDVMRRVVELALVADSGCELVESDLDFFLGTAPPGTVKQGHPLYV